jgi:hypothetical protein
VQAMKTAVSQRLRQDPRAALVEVPVSPPLPVPSSVVTKSPAITTNALSASS